MQRPENQDTSIRVSKIVHGEVVEHLDHTERKIGKFTEIALREKMQREKKIKKK